VPPIALRRGEESAAAAHVQQPETLQICELQAVTQRLLTLEHSLFVHKLREKRTNSVKFESIILKQWHGELQRLAGTTQEKTGAGGRADLHFG